MLRITCHRSKQSFYHQLLGIKIDHELTGRFSWSTKNWKNTFNGTQIHGSNL